MTDLTSLKYTDEHEWVALAGDVATVGITDYAADKLGDVVFVDLPAVGSTVTAARSAARSSRRSRSASSTPRSPARSSRSTTPSSTTLFRQRRRVRRWLVKIQVDPADVDALMDRAAYVALTGGEE
jgi:glycine cleavage system H protein